LASLLRYNGLVLIIPDTVSRLEGSGGADFGVIAKSQTSGACFV